jgi:hypothetical protein
VTDKAAQATVTGLQATSGSSKQWCGVKYATRLFLFFLLCHCCFCFIVSVCAFSLVHIRRSSQGLAFKGGDPILYFEVTVGAVVASGAQGTARIGITAQNGALNIGTVC